MLAQVSYTIRKKCNLYRVSIYYAETSKSKREILGMSNYRKKVDTVVCISPQNNNHLTRPSFSLLPPSFNKRVKKHQRKPHFFVSNNYVLMKEWAVATAGVTTYYIYYPKQFRTSLTRSHAWRRITKYSSKQTFWLPFPSLHPHTCAHITRYKVSDMDGITFIKTATVFFLVKGMMVETILYKYLTDPIPLYWTPCIKVHT